MPQVMEASDSAIIPSSVRTESYLGLGFHSGFNSSYMDPYPELFPTQDCVEYSQQLGSQEYSIWQEADEADGSGKTVSMGEKNCVRGSAEDLDPSDIQIVENSDDNLRSLTPLTVRGSEE